jgi:hypothetical protein
MKRCQGRCLSRSSNVSQQVQALTLRIDQRIAEDLESYKEKAKLCEKITKSGLLKVIQRDPESRKLKRYEKRCRRALILWICENHVFEGWTQEQLEGVVQAVENGEIEEEWGIGERLLFEQDWDENWE